jgi:DHA3 family multidrug efflux protein-like MFS transporter
MTNGAGADLIGDWYGVGQGRGIALVFTATGLIGLIITLLAMRSKQYKQLSKAYLK